MEIRFINKNRVENIDAFRIVSKERWRDAISSFGGERYLAAVYLAGYSVECILKYVILQSKLKGRKNFSFSDVTNLLDNDYGAFERPHRIDLLFKVANETVFSTPAYKDFKFLAEWNSEWRYSEQRSTEELADFALDYLRLTRTFVQEIIFNTDSRLRIKTFEDIPPQQGDGK